LSKTIYFVRHGQTEWNAIERMQGRWNSDLNELGRRQADQNGRLLRGLGVQTLLSSPLDRARQTAEIIGKYVDLPVQLDERIVEWDCGEWSGHLVADVMERWPEEWAALLADAFHYRPPGGENYADLFERARPFVDEVSSLDLSSIAIVSHGMIGKVMVSLLLGLNEDETLAIYQPNDVVFRVSIREGGAEAHHYRGGGGAVEGLVGLEG